MSRGWAGCSVGCKRRRYPEGGVDSFTQTLEAGDGREGRAQTGRTAGADPRPDQSYVRPSTGRWPELRSDCTEGQKEHLKKKVRTNTATVCGLKCLSQVGSITRPQKATYPDHRRPSMLMNGGSITSFTSLFFFHRFYRLSRGIYRFSGTCFSFASLLFRALVQYTPLLLYPFPDCWTCDPTSVNKSVLFLNQA